MTQNDGLWFSYSGSARIALALILLGVAAVVVAAATRLNRPIRLPRPGRALMAGLLTAWVLAIVAFLSVIAALTARELRDHTAQAQPANPVTLVTLMAAFILFLIVFVATPDGLWVKVSSAAIAAMAAPMIFELPFDLIIIARVPAPSPGLEVYRVLFFAFLFLIELTTLSLLSMTPMVRVARPACYCFAVMLLVYAVWALGGFGYPNTAFAIAMNDVSKILAFVTALSLFFPQWFTPWRARQQPAVPSGECLEDLVIR